jgi:hypothetical protein
MHPHMLVQVFLCELEWLRVHEHTTPAILENAPIIHPAEQWIINLTMIII